MGNGLDELAADAAPVLFEDSVSHDSDTGATNVATTTWRPLFSHECTFGPPIFDSVVDNLIHNPNINSSWLFRADILHDAQAPPPPPRPTTTTTTSGLCATCTTPTSGSDSSDRTCTCTSPRTPSFIGFERQRCIVRKLIPRNTLRDAPLDQTCLLYTGTLPGSNEHDGGANGDDDTAVERKLVVYLPHVSAPSDMPFYHPKVRGVAFLYEWNQAESRGSVSISYRYFDEGDRSVEKLTRTAHHLVAVILKHGKGRVEGYTKRVHHDLLLPQARVQNTYTKLKQKHARTLIRGWAESTDPEKHIFEDLCIASFLMELWADMYGGPGEKFPGFVDIGCGNGLLVYILIREGFTGWGFDARSRKSWASYNIKLPSSASASSGETDDEDSLRELVLLPTPVSRQGRSGGISSEDFDARNIHDGRFPTGTFIISNHADELTAWTPIIAALSECPFLAIPCCSHDLTGKLFRAPPPKDKTKAESTYSSFVVWVSSIAEDCGWHVEQEMLRIPSTRNTAIVGRKLQQQSQAADQPSSSPLSSHDVQAIVDKYGGTAGYLDSVLRLVKKNASSSH
ncbi:hypothetical protein QBC35DRAFT_152730 [Podospora australis]|uniref:tRNA (uracil-O(2)-)-methyltransferase n=1 Tax=Podospora australis TaxID=1536484 RepID=A0AAN6WZ86_9PEZI|nr:hypothetical protein QBC35DRAFT_152730 [Podospora australis]